MTTMTEQEQLRHDLIKGTGAWFDYLQAKDHGPQFDYFKAWCLDIKARYGDTDARQIHDNARRAGQLLYLETDAVT